MCYSPDHGLSIDISHNLKLYQELYERLVVKVVTNLQFRFGTYHGARFFLSHHLHESFHEMRGFDHREVVSVGMLCAARLTVTIDRNPSARGQNPLTLQRIISATRMVHRGGYFSMWQYSILSGETSSFAGNECSSSNSIASGHVTLKNSLMTYVIVMTFAIVLGSLWRDSPSSPHAIIDIIDCLRRRRSVLEGTAFR